MVPWELFLKAAKKLYQLHSKDLSCMKVNGGEKNVHYSLKVF